MKQKFHDLDLLSEPGFKIYRKLFYPIIDLDYGLITQITIYLQSFEVLSIHRLRAIIFDTNEMNYLNALYLTGKVSD